MPLQKKIKILSEVRFRNDLLKLLFTILMGCILVETTAQNTTDTLQLSRNFSAQKDFGNAINILKLYYKIHPQDIYAVQLLALNYYWDGQIEVADSFYKINIEKYPQYAFLKLDYARMLFELSRFNKAKMILDNYITEFPDNIEALEYLGYINYWWGEFRLALDNFKRILKIYPQNASALKMAETIELVINPYLFTSHQFSYDSQPLQSGESKIEIGKYYSPKLKPVFRINFLYFISEEVKPVPWIQLGNEFNFFKNKTRLNANIGLYRNILSKTKLTGIFTLDQAVTNKLSITLKGESRPYFYTLSSLKEPVSFQAVNATVSWSDPSGINVQASSGRHFFMDGKKINNSYLWVISPYFGWKKIKFNIGYSFNYSNSTANNFESKISLSEILTDYQPGEIKGVYVPYFTPADQNIHSLVGSASLFTEKNFELQLKGNVSIYSYADIPFLFLNNNIDGNIFIDRGYSKEVKVPYELSIKASYYFNRKIILNAFYIYTENFFYLNNMFNLNLKYIF